MLRPYQKLHHNKDFIHVFEKGKRHSLGGVLLFWCKNELDHTRIGFSIGKKYSLSAVKRNKQRRLFQVAIREIYPTIRSGYDIVISYTNHGKVLPYKEVIIILKKIFDEIHLLK